VHVLCLCFQWVFLDIQLLAPSGPGTVIPEENLSLVCKVTSFSISTSGYAWDWIRQPPGKVLEWIAAINHNSGGKWYAPSLKSRATISSDASKNEFSLQLTSLTVADSAVYFCARSTHSERRPIGDVYKKRKLILSTHL
uniref:Ig-like domain-containing protein n=1 Tax=Podarcis muralis TaxID=64176 RepID=A0A670K6I0_PODMU